MNGPMDDDKFAHMLKLSTMYIPVMRSKELFDGPENMDSTDINQILVCLVIVADTFVEMQRRLGAKPKFTVKSGRADRAPATTGER